MTYAERPDSDAPVVLLIPGSLANVKSRARFARSITREIDLAEREGRLPALLTAIDALIEAVPTASPGSLLVARGGADPCVVEVPDYDGPRILRLIVHLDAPPWIQRILHGQEMQQSA